jgi:hypothetical protein
MVGAIGFEPTTSWSQTRRSTRLSYTPKTDGMGRIRPRTVNILIGLLSQGQIEPLPALTGLQKFLPVSCGQIVWILLSENQFKFSDELTSLARVQAVFRKSTRKIIGNADVALSTLQAAQNVKCNGA